MQKHRISTNIGKDQKVTVELKQDYDLLEILSLRFDQEQAYSSFCSDYGVVCGRVSVNNGLGIPNAKVSIFVPLTAEHEDDPVISTLYPYKTVSDTNINGYRYNLLPSRKQHGGHEPTGTFYDQTEILTREEYLEVYETYYSYTVKTNDAGDFMIWGVPLGQQIIHIDVDMSDMGCFSLRPYDLSRLGLGDEMFKNTYEFKASEDLDSLPQIKSFNKTIEVYPFWGNEDFCELGISRVDFDLSEIGVKVEPKAFLIGGTYTDPQKHSVNNFCQLPAHMGRKCDLRTQSGKIESIRFTPVKDSNNRPILEQVKINEDIPEDGSFVMPIPMNMDYVYTNEFGDLEVTNDKNKGVPTSACQRFRLSLDNQGNDTEIKNAYYLVPNIREYSGTTESEKSYAFSTNWDDYPTLALTNNSDRGIFYTENGEYNPRDYFYRLNYNKVYTVSSFQNTFFSGDTFSGDKFLGIKEIVPPKEEDCASDVVTPPVNFGVKNYSFTLLIAEVLLFFEQLINLLTLTFFNVLAFAFFAFADAVDFYPIRSLANLIRRFAYSFQDSTQRAYYLINYPECVECNGTNSFGTQGAQGATLTYCQVGTLEIVGSDDQNNRLLTASNFAFSVPDNGLCSATATPITNTTDFVTRQTSYFLTNGTINIPISSGQFAYDSGTSGYTFNDTDGYFVESSTYTLVIRDENHTSTSSSTTTAIESGCDLYDIPYDESLVRLYYIGTGRTPSSTYTPGADVTSTNLSDDTNYPLVTSYDGRIFSPFTPSGQSEFSNGVFYIIPGTLTTSRIYGLLKEYRRRKRMGKMFCGGIVNYSFIDNWLSGSLYFFLFKAYGTETDFYCSSIVKYSTTQEKFYYRSAIYNSESSWGITKSYNKILGRPTTLVDLGPRDEFIKEICTDPKLDPNCSVVRTIGPTSFQNFGELLGLAINYRMDVGNADFDLNGFFANGGFSYTTYPLNGDILQLISINNEVGIEGFDLQNQKYLGYSYQTLDPDIYPDVFKNGTSVYGPLPITFDLKSGGDRVRSCINEGTHLDYSGNTVQGRLTESSQKVPFFLWDKKGTGFGLYNSTQYNDQSWQYSSVEVQPLQGMTKNYIHNGPYDDSGDKYLLLPITYTFSGLTVSSDVTTQVLYDVVTTSSGYTSYNSEYPGFTYLYVTGGTASSPSSGILFTRYGSAGNNVTNPITGTTGWSAVKWDSTKDFVIRRTQDYYSGSTTQILSTPFQFYFGLKAGKTGVDKFIKLFGDKGAFTSAE